MSVSSPSIRAGLVRRVWPSLSGLLDLVLMVSLAGCSSTAATPLAATSAPTADPVNVQLTAMSATATAALPAAPAAGLPALPAGMGAPPNGAGGPSQVITPTVANLAYANASATEVLDLYLPAGAGPFPVVVNIHAGGFALGDKGMVPGSTAKALVAAGYAVASLNYRLSGEAVFPAAVLDAKAAVRFLRANAAKYNLNPDKIAAFGQSAGGNLAAMLGTTGGVAEFDDASLGNPGVSSNVQAVIDWFGPTDF